MFLTQKLQQKDVAVMGNLFNSTVCQKGYFRHGECPDFFIFTSCTWGGHRNPLLLIQRCVQLIMQPPLLAVCIHPPKPPAATCFCCPAYEDDGRSSLFWWPKCLAPTAAAAAAVSLHLRSQLPTLSPPPCQAKRTSPRRPGRHHCSILHLFWEMQSWEETEVIWILRAP